MFVYICYFILIIHTQFAFFLVFITSEPAPGMEGSKNTSKRSGSKGGGLSRLSQEEKIYVIICSLCGFLFLVFALIFVVYCKVLKREGVKNSESVEESSTDANLNKKSFITKYSMDGNSTVSLDTNTTMPLIHKTGSTSLWSASFQHRLQSTSNPSNANGNVTF